MFSNRKNILILTVVILLVGAVGFMAGRYLNVSKKDASTAPTVTNLPSFPFRSAMIQGQITNITDTLLTVTDQDGHAEKLQAARNLAVTKYSKAGTASPSAGLKNIELNKPGQILLVSKDGKFQIQLIIYIATASAKPK